MIVGMKKLLRPQDILLLGLSGVLDVLQEIKDPFGIMAKGYENMYGIIPRRYRRRQFNHLVWRSLKTGYIEKVVKNGIPYLRLTSSGKNKIKRDFSFLKFQASKWDRRWRVIVFDIEELTRSTRNGVRRKLKELGFGMFQESVYISPYDITQDMAEFIESKHLDEAVYVLEVSRISSGDIKFLVNKIWKLDRINKEYQELIEEMEDGGLITFDGRIKKLNHKSFEKEFGKQNENRDLIKKIYERYLGILMKDPLLPYELLPDNWHGKRVRRIIKELMKV